MGESRQRAGDPASDPSVGNSGNIAFTGINITLGVRRAKTANLFNQVDPGSASSTRGPST